MYARLCGCVFDGHCSAADPTADRVNPINININIYIDTNVKS